MGRLNHSQTRCRTFSGERGAILKIPVNFYCVLCRFLAMARYWVLGLSCPTSGYCAITARHHFSYGGFLLVNRLDMTEHFITFFDTEQYSQCRRECRTLLNISNFYRAIYDTLLLLKMRK